MLVTGEQQLQLFPETQSAEQGQLALKTFGFVDLDKLQLLIPRLQIVAEIVERQRFFSLGVGVCGYFSGAGGV